jgi:hypothetical protein
MMKAMNSAAFACGAWAWQSLLVRMYPDDVMRAVFGIRRSPIGGVFSGRLTGGLYAKSAR